MPLSNELYKMGLLDGEVFRSDLEYTQEFISIKTQDGYRRLAFPIVYKIKKHPWIIYLVKPFVLAWAGRTHYLMGRTRKKHTLGAVLKAIGIPFCNIINRISPLRYVEVD
jgi:hypothetical protein